MITSAKDQLRQKDRVIGMLIVFCVCVAITGFSAGFASGFVSKGFANAIAETNRN